MKVHYSDDSVSLYHGDCLDVLRELPDNSVDSVVTDPPYGISFMGREWDQPGEFGSNRRGGGGLNKKRGKKDAALEAGRYDLSSHAMHNFQEWCERWATESLRVLKPGGHMLAFGGSRTWHRLACAVEDAGFEIRDSIAWLYGSGFPKSLDVSKAIDKAAGVERASLGAVEEAVSSRTDSLGVFAPEYEATAPATPDAERWQGWGTALKPAFEPIVVGRKPLTGTVAANVLEHGTGALNVDGCRIATTDALGGGANKGMTSDTRHEGFARPWMDDDDARNAAAARSRENTERAEMLGRWPTNVVLDETQAAELDKQSGVTTSPDRVTSGGKALGVMNDDGWEAQPGKVIGNYGDTGGASRFFPTFRYEAKAPTSERPRVGDTAHPTVKPLDLMQWLVRLVTPPDGTVLEPFAGSGTTAEACVIEGFRCIAIEREATYLPLIVARLTKPIQVGLDFDGDAA